MSGVEKKKGTRFKVDESQVCEHCGHAMAVIFGRGGVSVLAGVCTETGKPVVMLTVMENAGEQGEKIPEDHDPGKILLQWQIAFDGGKGADVLVDAIYTAMNEAGIEFSHEPRIWED